MTPKQLRTIVMVSHLDRTTRSLIVSQLPRHKNDLHRHIKLLVPGRCTQPLGTLMSKSKSTHVIAIHDQLASVWSKTNKSKFQVTALGMLQKK
jgi:hypothetical protein